MSPSVTTSARLRQKYVKARFACAPLVVFQPNPVIAARNGRSCGSARIVRATAYPSSSPGNPMSHRSYHIEKAFE
jgi:hypothetical protein